MVVKQVYDILNTITGEQLGESVVVAEDLSNIVEVGQAFESIRDGMDNFVRQLNDHIGRMVFVDRVYSGRAPKLLMDGWEYGSIMEKVSMDLPEATENESWELQDGSSYDPNIFYKPSVSVSFWNQRVTFEIPMSFTEKQVKSAFTTAQQMNSFMSMIYTAIANSMTIKLDSLIMRTVNNLIAETVHDDYGSAAIGSKSGVKAVNLLYLYNQTVDTPITAAEAMMNKDFLRFAAQQMKLYKERMATMSTLFNIGGKARFTPEDRLHTILLSEFASAADVYLGSDTFHDTMVALPNAETVAYWQGSGTDYGFASTSKIQLTKTASGDAVTVTGVLGVMFDHDAAGVSNVDRRVTTNFNPKGEFFSEWHKFDAGYYNDLNENAVVFFAA